MISDYVTYFDSSKPHHRAWLQAVLERLEALDPKALDANGELRKLWVSGSSVNLKIPYFSQNDNVSGTGYRECFSSSCAMLASYWGKVSGDDAYNQIRSKFGDSTDAQAQLLALRSLGLAADFRTDGTPELLKQELNAGRPVAVGWLHQGSAKAPTGFGHWTVAIGHRPGFWQMNDPNGEADLVNGGYTRSRNGANLSYSTANWNPRWMVRGTGGWMLTCKRQ